MYRGDFEGIPLRLIDTPGLEVSQAEMGSNLEKLGKIKFNVLPAHCAICAVRSRQSATACAAPAHYAYFRVLSTCSLGYDYTL